MTELSKEEINEIKDYQRKINDLEHMIANLNSQKEKLAYDLIAVQERVNKRLARKLSNG